MSAFNFQHEFVFYIKQMAPQDCQFYQSAGPTAYHVKMSAKGTYHTLFLKDPWGVIKYAISIRTRFKVSATN